MASAGESGAAAGDDAAAQALAWKDKGNTHFKAKRFRDAIADYTQAIELDPTAAYFCNRAFAYIKTEAYGAALEDASSAIKLDKNFVKAYYRRASANMALGKFKLSLRDYKAVLKVKPKDKDAQKKAAECEKIVNRVAFERAIAVESRDEKSAYDKVAETAMSLAVDSKYEGPRFEETITLEFVQEMISTFKAQGKLHTKFALKILLLAHDLLKTLPSLVDCTIPAGKQFTICGDVHGQYYDLLNIFELNGMPSEDNPYLFNGDFVDRGSFSVEVILTLLSFRILYPDHFHMTRGNHETEQLNKMYGFEGEVKAKYNAKMMDLFTEVYQWLPLGHVINGKVMCVHGGLFSEDGVKLDDIRTIKRNRQPPEKGIMCEILWADPQPQPGRGMSKRGTGVQFGPDVTERFLEDNGLSLLVRSHEVKDDGYEVAHGGKCITIFSAPNYCDQMGNKGAFITLKEDLVPKFTTFASVPHPPVRAMAYAGMYGGLM